MFKKLLTTVFVGILFFNIAFAENNTPTNQELLNLITQLQAQITDLQAQLQSVKTELKFTRALMRGATGEDVKQLQEFLKNFTGSYPDGLVTGYYGPLTEKAVKKFQEQNGIESVGVVGPKTQEKLNVLAAAVPSASANPTTSAGAAPSETYTGQTTTTVKPADQTSTSTGAATAPLPATQGSTTPGTSCTNCSPTTQFTPSVIKVISPNGGEQWQIGGTHIIKYSAKNIAGDKALLIYLEKGYDTPTTKTGANTSLLIGITTNPESYAYTVPQNIQSFPGLGNNYTIRICGQGSYSASDAISYICASGDATFGIAAAMQTNIPTSPTVSATDSNNSGSGSGTSSSGQTIPLFMCSTPGQTVTICHRPPGNTNNGQTLTVSCNATGLEGHSNHQYDTLGACLVPDTTAPIITNIKAANITQTTANITWTTDEASTSDIYYSKLSPLFSGETLKESTAGNVAGHSATLLGLSPYSTYYYSVSSKDAAGNTATSGTNSFQTLQEPVTTPTTKTITATADTGGIISPAGSVVVTQWANKTFSITPDSGYNISAVLVDGVNQGAVSSYTFINVQTTHTISATFSRITYSITVAQGTNGTISPGTTSVVSGGGQTFAITPATGYQISSVAVDGANQGSISSYTFTNVIAAHTISAVFSQSTYSIVVTQGVNGTISPTGTSVVTHGVSKTFSITPATGYQISNLIVDGVNVADSTSYTFSNITSSHTFSAVFAPVAIVQYSITASAGIGGSISPAGSVEATAGANKTFSITPDSGYNISSVSVDGVNQGAVSSYTFTNIQTTHTISATFSQITYSITVAQGTNGTISPGTTSVVSGGGQTFAITPATGYQISSVSVDGINQGVISSYTFTNVQAAHTISASFTAILPIGLPAPTELRVGFGVGSGASNWVKTSESLSFKFDINSLSKVSAFRLYQKKPQDSAFSIVGEFSNPSGITACYTQRIYGTWSLSSLGGGPTGCPGPGWHLSRTGMYPVSSYTVGDYLYYVTAVDLSGTEGPASKTSISTFIGTFPIQTPITVETSGSSNPTFRWQAASGWSGALSYWVIVAPSDGSSSQRMLTPITSSGPAISKIYDGPALIPDKQYSVWIYGRTHNADQTEDKMSFASEVATFSVTSAVTATPSANALANILETMKGILNQMQETLKNR